MKKLLSMLGAVSLMTASASLTVACGNETATKSVDGKTKMYAQIGATFLRTYIAYDSSDIDPGFLNNFLMTQEVGKINPNISGIRNDTKFDDALPDFISGTGPNTGSPEQPYIDNIDPVLGPNLKKIGDNPAAIGKKQDGGVMSQIAPIMSMVLPVINSNGGIEPTFASTIEGALAQLPALIGGGLTSDTAKSVNDALSPIIDAVGPNIGIIKTILPIISNSFIEPAIDVAVQSDLIGGISSMITSPTSNPSELIDSIIKILGGTGDIAKKIDPIMSIVLSLGNLVNNIDAILSGFGVKPETASAIKEAITTTIGSMPAFNNNTSLTDLQNTFQASALNLVSSLTNTKDATELLDLKAISQGESNDLQSTFTANLDEALKGISNISISEDNIVPVAISALNAVTSLFLFISHMNIDQKITSNTDSEHLFSEKNSTVDDFNDMLNNTKLDDMGDIVFDGDLFSTDIEKIMHNIKLITELNGHDQEIYLERFLYTLLGSGSDGSDLSGTNLDDELIKSITNPIQNEHGLFNLFFTGLANGNFIIDNITDIISNIGGYIGGIINILGGPDKIKDLWIKGKSKGLLIKLDIPSLSEDGRGLKSIISSGLPHLLDSILLNKDLSIINNITDGKSTFDITLKLPGGLGNKVPELINPLLSSPMLTFSDNKDKKDFETSVKAPLTGVNSGRLVESIMSSDQLNASRPDMLKGKDINFHNIVSSPLNQVISGVQLDKSINDIIAIIDKSFTDSDFHFMSNQGFTNGITSILTGLFRKDLTMSTKYPEGFPEDAKLPTDAQSNIAAVIYGILYPYVDFIDKDGKSVGKGSIGAMKALGYNGTDFDDDTLLKGMQLLFEDPIIMGGSQNLITQLINLFNDWSTNQGKLSKDNYYVYLNDENFKVNNIHSSFTYEANNDSVISYDIMFTDPFNKSIKNTYHVSMKLTTGSPRWVYTNITKN